MVVIEIELVIVYLTQHQHRTEAVMHRLEASILPVIKVKISVRYVDDLLFLVILY